MAERTISKKTRFEVFKRDSFCCQYCGRKAPEVVLEVDHIIAIANGGKNTITNLITSCFDCNRGKGKRALSENTQVDKQMKQLELLNERKILFDTIKNNLMKINIRSEIFSYLEKIVEGNKNGSS